MKRFILFILTLSLVCACGPGRHIMHVEMRYPSKAGVDLAGKISSVVYLETADAIASSFSSGMAATFASELEKDLGTGEGSVAVYKMRKNPGADYASRDSLLNLLVDTDADVVFLFDEVKLGEAEAAASGVKIPFTMDLYCFDGMDESEKVKSFRGTSMSHADGVDAGKTVAASFKTQWKTEPYSLAYYDSEKWYKALDKAEAYDWKGAIDQWFTLLDTNDLMRRSCAEYNIAVACYMLGDYALAAQWLDRSDADNMLPNFSEALRKRIEARK